MFSKQSKNTDEVKPVSEVIADVENVVGEENMQVQLQGDRFPQLRLSIDRNFLFLRVSDYEAGSDEIQNLLSLGWEPTKNGHSTATLQYRAYYESSKLAQESANSE